MSSSGTDSSIFCFGDHASYIDYWDGAGPAVSGCGSCSKRRPNVEKSYKRMNNFSSSIYKRVNTRINAD